MIEHRFEITVDGIEYVVDAILGTPPVTGGPPDSWDPGDPTEITRIWCEDGEDVSSAESFERLEGDDDLVARLAEAVEAAADEERARADARYAEEVERDNADDPYPWADYGHGPALLALVPVAALGYALAGAPLPLSYGVAFGVVVFGVPYLCGLLRATRDDDAEEV